MESKNNTVYDVATDGSLSVSTFILSANEMLDHPDYEWKNGGEFWYDSMIGVRKSDYIPAIDDDDFRNEDVQLLIGPEGLTR